MKMKLFWVMIMAVVGLIFIENIQTADAVFGIVMNPCDNDKCIEACKNILKEKFQSASCFQRKLCNCFGG